MSEAPVAEKAKLRHYNDAFIVFGFVSADAKPMCLEFGVMLTNDSMKKVKLMHHRKSKHPSSVGKDKKYFERIKKKHSQSNYSTLSRRIIVQIQSTQTKLVGRSNSCQGCSTSSLW